MSGSTTIATGEESADDQPAAGAQTPEAPRPPMLLRGRWWVRHYTYTGTMVGLIFVWLSLTPSLLPRGPLFQGVVSGFSGAIGYGLGVFGVWLVRYMRSQNSTPAAPPWAWLPLIVVGAIGMVVMAIRFHVWQDNVRDMMGVEHLKWYDYPLTAVLSMIVLFTLVEIGQFIRLAGHSAGGTGRSDRAVPRLGGHRGHRAHGADHHACSTVSCSSSRCVP